MLVSVFGCFHRDPTAAVLHGVHGLGCAVHATQPLGQGSKGAAGPTDEDGNDPKALTNISGTSAGVHVVRRLKNPVTMPVSKNASFLRD